ncbi:TPA: type III secretion apparatus needle protein [Yersinia enterocolitica]|nr:type III secretion apparatus needle protein [Yersinia enterocolitica]HDL7833894.1 type III secretion apparatus needle protein [Yersinia enterocolitica]HDL7874110.1 type III secretion apparatus needle protein [Yersinia enterocolitica]HDL7887319.1 type III secretion apparatus needle protein [Yersinia enterocolitica]HDL7895989.1 type III secretion apparatus needle protein [Yersinia enterocolitica]
MAAINGLTPSGHWEETNLEKVSTNSKWGVAYQVGGLMNDHITKLGDELHTQLNNATDLDSPLKLAKIAALSGNFNAARQLQSSLMKAIKDTSQAIIRNI